jgi:uncharacterized protein YjiS (DUF1127 family)
MLTSIARLYQAWKRHEAARRELSHLSDRELADIGITRISTGSPAKSRITD